MSRCLPPASNHRAQIASRCTPPRCRRRAARFPGLPASRLRETSHARGSFPCQFPECQPATRPPFLAPLPSFPALQRAWSFQKRRQMPAGRTNKSPHISSWKLLPQRTCYRRRSGIFKQSKGVHQSSTITGSRQKFTVSLVECLGSCGTAPMFQLNFDYHENLTPAKVDQILDSLP